MGHEDAVDHDVQALDGCVYAQACAGALFLSLANCETMDLEGWNSCVHSLGKVALRCLYAIE